MGDSRKYPYPAIGDKNALNTLAFQNSKVITTLTSTFLFFISTLRNPKFDSLRLPMKESLLFYIFLEVFVNNFPSNNCLQGSKLWPIWFHAFAEQI